MTEFDQAMQEAAIRSAMEYCTPGVLFFIAQTVACLCCKSKWLRLTPTFIVAGIALYHVSVVLAEIPSPWIVLSIPYLLAYVAPSLLGVGLGWAIYVVKLVITEFKQMKA